MVINKKGISAIVATVLIILITVVGVGIIWGGIMPLFKSLNYLSYSEIKLDVLTQGYTVYDPDMHFAFVQVARGNDNLNLTAVEIVFSINGTSVPYRNYDSPTKNGKKTYKFNFTYYGVDGAPSTVGVAPVFKLNGEERVGTIVSNKIIPNQKIELSAPEWAAENVQAITSVVKDETTGKWNAPNESSNNCTTSVSCDDGNSCTLNDQRICFNGLLGACMGVAQQEIINNNVDENCDGWADLNNCSVLSQAGMKYRLINNLLVSSQNNLDANQRCFSIGANNITFNLNGYNISSGTAIQGTAIFAGNLLGVSMQNGGIIGFANNSIKLHNINGSLFEGLKIWSTGSGIYLENGSLNTFRNLTFRDNKVVTSVLPYCFGGGPCYTYRGESLRLISSYGGFFSNITLLNGYNGIFSEGGRNNYLSNINAASLSNVFSITRDSGSQIVDCYLNSTWTTASLDSRYVDNILIKNVVSVGEYFLFTNAAINDSRFLAYYYAPDFVGPPSASFISVNSTLVVSNSTCLSAYGCPGFPSDFTTIPPDDGFVGPRFP